MTLHIPLTICRICVCGGGGQMTRKVSTRWWLRMTGTCTCVKGVHEETLDLEVTTDKTKCILETRASQAWVDDYV